MSNQTLHFTTTINAPVATVRDIMLSHPTYEERTKAFSEWSTYIWSWDQWSEIKFVGPSGQWGMLAMIAHNTLHEYLSIKHLGEIGADGHITKHEYESFENYRFITINDNTTQLDIEMTAMPNERVDMFNDMWPKALKLLKELCEQ